MTSNPSFQPTCPVGGSWYACGNGAKFTGCCGSDPCDDNGCPAGSLFPASFEKSAYGQFPDQQCSAGLWYTCIWEGQIPETFMGCCTINPCSNKGCPTDSMAAGYLSANPTIAEQFDPFPPLPESSASSSTTTAANLTVNSQAQSEGVSVGVIIGCAIGGFVFVLTMLLILWRAIYRQRRRSQVRHGDEYAGGLSRMPIINERRTILVEKDAIGDTVPFLHSAQTYSNQSSPAPQYQQFEGSHSRTTSTEKGSPEIFEADSHPVLRTPSPTSGSRNFSHHSLSHSTTLLQQQSPRVHLQHEHTPAWESGTISAVTGSPYGSPRLGRVLRGPPVEMGQDIESLSLSSAPQRHQHGAKQV